MRSSPFILSVLLFLCGCSSLQRSSESGYAPDNAYKRISSEQDRQTQKTAYEMGKDPGQLSASDLSEIRQRQKVRELERTLQSKKEREQYSKVLPWLKNDSEKIAFLSIPSIEGRQQWINRENIWSRSQAPQEQMRELINAQDIAIGMPQEYVRRSWGEPVSIDISGNPIYKNERWRYQRMVPSSEGYRKEVRFVYFESGRVVGWETE